MANLTLKVDDDLLRRARIRALETGTSINQVVREQLAAFAGREQSAVGWESFLESARSTTARTPQGRDWNRADLYRE